MKYYLFLLLFSATLVSSQTLKKIKITDAETGKAIPDARIILEAQIFYSNDDGLLSLPKSTAPFEVSMTGYETLYNTKYQSTIKLKPRYKDIDEIKIVAVDIKKIFKEVSKHYRDRYYDKPAVYDITFSQKAFENDHLKLLMVADGKYWTRDGNFNSKEAFHNKYDNFVQMQITDLRYLKTGNRDFDIKLKPEKGNTEFIGNLFFNYELHRIISLINRNKATTSARILYDNETEQEISFRVKLEEDLIYTGTIIFNKRDRAITRYEMVFEQSNSKPGEYKDLDGEPYLYYYPNGVFTFDFYKMGDHYVPSKTSIGYNGSKYIQGTRSFQFRSVREIIYKNFKPSNTKGLDNRVEIQASFWKDMSISDDKDLISLSEEEQNFINEKKDEN